MASTDNIERPEKEQTTMFQGKNIHSSPVDGKLLCSFSEKTCMQRRLNHYAFCIRHVLEDKNAPFKQCKFVAKYNGQRCTNAIPVKEERIYCNSHLQVLGIVPKKSRKKKLNDQNDSTSQNPSRNSQAEIFSPRSTQNAVIKRVERSTIYTGTSKPLTDESASKKAKMLSSNPVLLELVGTYSRARSQRRDLFPYYGLCSSDEDSLSDEDSEDDFKLNLNQHKNSTVLSEPERVSRTKSESLHCASRAARLRELRGSLRAEFLSVKKSIIVHHQDVKLSNRALDLLMVSAKRNPALTAVAIQNDTSTVSTNSRKRPAPKKPNTIQCTAVSLEKTKCKRTAVPYAKYCSDHITDDNKQQLFHKCVADISADTKCSEPALDLLYEKPLCRDHAMGKAAYHPVAVPVEASAADVPLPSQKPLAKKPRRKPQVRASPTQKPVKPSKKASKKELQKTPKSEKNKKPVNLGLVPVNANKEILPGNSTNHISFEKTSPGFLSVNLVSQDSMDYLPNGNVKVKQSLPPSKNDINSFENNDFKEPEIFDSSEMDVDESLEQEDLNIPEDLGDISPTGMLRDSVLKLPLEISEPRGTSHLKGQRKSPIDSYTANAVNEGNLPKPIVLTDRVEPPRKASLSTNNKQNNIQARGNHMPILPGVRPTRSSVITLPKFPSNTASLGASLTTRHTLPVSSAEFTSFTPIGPNIVKSESGVRKSENRAVEVSHGLPLFPLPFDAVLNSSVTWGGGGKLVLNNRARPSLLNSQMNPATFSPPSISPHVSPQVSLGTAFNFDRPSVLQHSNSSSPTLTPFNTNLQNSPHGKLPSRTFRLESRGIPNSEMDPFFGATYDKP